MKDKTMPVESAHTGPAAAVPGDATEAPPPPIAKDVNSSTAAVPQPKREFGGPKGLEPTRYGDWERNGRCYDF